MNILLKVITIIGNIAFILWIGNNMVSTEFLGITPEFMSSVSLVILLTLNTSLLLRG